MLPDMGEIFHIISICFLIDTSPIMGILIGNKSPNMGEVKNRVYSFSKEKTAGILRELREEAGLSRKQLADLSNVGEESIKGYEKGNNVMSLEAAVKLSNALGVNPSDLVGK